ncbi:MAG: hypothetical protein ABI295_01835 [Xanthomarina sp.]
MANSFLAFYFLEFFHFDGIIRFEMLIAPVFTVLYFATVKKKALLFALFLLIYSIADLINFFNQGSFKEVLYFVCNGLYMLSYIFLFLEIIKTVNMRIILKKFPIHFIVLTLLNIYIIFVMITIINPIVFATNHVITVQIAEQAYNSILLVILSMSFLNYILNESNSALLLFCACLAITFADFLIIGYFYLSKGMNLIRYVTVALELMAFLLFYFHANVKLKSTVPVT